MGIDTNGYCTQCRTYRGVPQAPQPPVSGTPYSGDPYSGAPYAGYQSSGPSFPDQQVSGSGYPGGGYPGQASGPAYPGQVSGPPAFPPATYGGQYGSSPTPPRRNKFMMPLIALSGVVVVLVIAIVAVVALRKDDDPKNVADPGKSANATASGSAAADSKIDKCLVGTWQTTTYTQTAAVDGVEGGLSLSLTKNGSTLKFTSDGKLTETFVDTVFNASPMIAGQKVPLTVTVNATMNADVQTTSGSIIYSNIKTSGNMVTTVPSLGKSETDTYDADDSPAKYTCSGDNLSFSNPQLQATAKRTAS
ncbi:hypothetical protein Daura_51345 [Dactylosporangium aurantiacum]|uniref:Uncharacterized protein n=1 Tax=Dactylosporangium aurantiacum TaxID=35754 RepID=A0A9Q9MD51_9ACTN|nr:hypothetical protein [Dactylosporangium aurantiacum]MDG6101273.1 hypothetical protein [Dactylosporangium aurantiacum]UWZ54713.1 hypothetical protein Daura_51345 [Dactylosporangium aurantiacum]